MPDREHTSKHYEQQLRDLKDKLLLMSHKAEEMISDSIRSLVERRPTLAEEVIDRDDEIDQLEIEVDNLCYEVLALEQPVARDLRFIATAQKILKEGLDAFVNSDAELAEKVILNDNVVDDLYEQIFRELLTYMLEDPRSISRAIKLIFIAKALERVGDHSANIAEMVVFLVKGQDIRHGTRLDRG